ncbi:tetraspanin 36 [Pungitius pungitius]|uniref:tetraspanin 36 n=1 Tax=Pungitius pungitius TaxID=134920 RepID=UPI002E15905B
MSRASSVRFSSSSNVVKSPDVFSRWIIGNFWDVIIKVAAPRRRQETCDQRQQGKQLLHPRTECCSLLPSSTSSSPARNMDCGIFTSKTVLLFLSLVFWVAGAALAYVGAYVIRSYDSFESFIQDKYTLVPAAIIIGISVVMFIFGLVGCCATLRESKVGLSFFFLIIMGMFAAEVAALVFGFIYQGKIKADLERSMNDVFVKYDGQGAETDAVDYLQVQLQCCGVMNYTSWSNTSWFSSHNNTVPASCCKNSTVCTRRLDQPDQLNTQGCEVKLERLLQGVLGYAMLVILGFAIIKFFGMLSVCVIACKTGSQRSGYQPLYA